VAFTGEVLPAPLPLLAAAVTAGVVSADHARTTIAAMKRLPVPVREAHGDVVEAEMVQAAGKVTPADLDGLAGEIMVRADPDGTLRDVNYAYEHRDLRLTKNRGRAGGKMSSNSTPKATNSPRSSWTPAPNPSPPPPALTVTPTPTPKATTAGVTTQPSWPTRWPGATPDPWGRAGTTLWSPSSKAS
jgi:Domain of unknown function (DUF222)